jgi:hypothetical protein
MYLIIFQPRNTPKKNFLNTFVEEHGPTTKFIKDNASRFDGASPQMMNSKFVGYLVLTRAKEVRKEITHVINGEWIDPSELPSGKNISGLYAHVRQEVLKSILHQKAKVSVRNAMRPKKDGQPGIVIDQQHTQQYWIDKKISLLLAEKVRPEDFIPTSWLVFVLHGAGATDERERLDFFLSGNLSTLNPVIPTDDLSYVESLGKQARKKKKRLDDKKQTNEMSMVDKGNVLHILHVRTPGLEGEARYKELSNLIHYLERIF